jgi:hypothetical protein
MVDTWKNSFTLFVQEEGTIEGHDELKSYITSYYQSVLGPSVDSDISRIEDISQVTKEKRYSYRSLFRRGGTKGCFLMEHNKAPGPDGFLTEFFQYFWDLIKGDLLDLFAELRARQLELFRINFGEIILLPMVNDVERIQRYIHICLLNVCFKIFTKIATIRLNTVADHVVHPT